MLAVIKFAKCKEGAKIPQRTPGSAGLDVYACFDEDYILINPHETKLIPTGIKSAIDPNYFALIEERGSTGSKGIKKSSGVMDADFRGEWKIIIYNANTIPLVISKLSIDETKQKLYGGFYGIMSNEDILYYPYTKAIAQALILPTPELDIEEWTDEEVSNVPSSRGEGMLGSSGK